jgi:hypothetical protein
MAWRRERGCLQNARGIYSSSYVLGSETTRICARFRSHCSATRTRYAQNSDDELSTCRCKKLVGTRVRKYTKLSRPKGFLLTLRRPADHWDSFFVSVSWGGVRLSPLGTSATNWSIVPAPDDSWWWMWSSRWNENWQRKPRYSEKTCSNAILSTINATWPGPGSNTDRLSYGTASDTGITDNYVTSRFLNRWDASHCSHLTVYRFGREVPKILINPVTLKVYCNRRSNFSLLLTVRLLLTCV